MKDTVLILGAGASVECGAPLINDFLPIAFSNEITSKLDKEGEKRFQNVEIFWRKHLPESNIEELISLIEFHLQMPAIINPPTPPFAKKIHDRIIKLKEGYKRDYSQIESAESSTTNLNSIYTDLKFLINKTLYFSLISNTDKKTKAKEMYNKFFQRYKESTIITFNWDILLENTFFNENVPLANLGFYNDYKVPLILKLHGSLSWNICPKCKMAYIFNTKMHQLPAEFCSECREKFRKEAEKSEESILEIQEKNFEELNNYFQTKQRRIRDIENQYRLKTKILLYSAAMVIVK